MPSEEAEIIGGFEESQQMQGLDRMEGDPGPDPAPVKPAKEEPKEPPSDQGTAQLEAMRRENEELRASNKAWMDVARGAKPAPEPKTPEPKSLAERLKIKASVADDTPDKFITDLESRGAAALADRGIVTEARLVEILEAYSQENKGGGITRAELDEAINTQVEALGVDRKLTKKHPELDDEDSEVFKLVQAEVRMAVEGGDRSVLSTAGVDRVARVVKAEMELAALKKNGAAPKPPDEGSRRRARAEAQDVSGNGSSGESDDAEEPSPEQARIAKKLGVPLARYAKRARAGIRMGGMPARP